MSLPGWAQIEFSELTVGEKIGGGGIGIIYQGRFRGQDVAIKTLFNPRVTEDVKKEYLDELLVMTKLQHSNIVKFLGANLTPPNLCFVMELCETSLFDILHIRREHLSIEESVRIGIDISSAMEYLHSLKPVIIHRDLKSHNVLRDFQGAYKLCDFGPVNCKVTQSGTPAYMPPELFGNRSFSKAVDVYSFGMLLWEVFSGDIPFHQVDIAEIKRRVLAGERPLNSPYSCPKRCLTLIHRCWYGLRLAAIERELSEVIHMWFDVCVCVCV